MYYFFQQQVSHEDQYRFVFLKETTAIGIKHKEYYHIYVQMNRNHDLRVTISVSVRHVKQHTGQEDFPTGSLHSTPHIQQHTVLLLLSMNKPQIKI